MNVLEVTKLSKRFGGLVANSEINMSVKKNPLQLLLVLTEPEKPHSSI